MHRRRTPVKALLASLAASALTVAGLAAVAPAAPALAAPAQTATVAFGCGNPAPAAAPVLDTGMTGSMFGPGMRVTPTITLDQQKVVADAMPALRALRGKAWDLNPPFRPYGETVSYYLQDYLQRNNVTSRQQYMDSVTWDQGIERAAVLRLAETAINGMDHERPNGAGGFGAENLASSGSLNYAITNQWGAELDDLIAANGEWTPSDGHVHNLLGLSRWRHAYAGRNGMSVALMQSGTPGPTTPTNWKGTYRIPVGLVAQAGTNVQTSTGLLGIGSGCAHTLNATAYGTTTPVLGTYSSSDSNVVSVDANGFLTPRKPGSATISVVSGDTTIRTTYQVADLTAPTVTVNPATVTIPFKSAAPDLLAGVSVTDNYDTGLTATASGTVDTNRVGQTTITYTARDAAGNVGRATRTYIVADVTAPVITAPQDRTLPAGAPNPDLMLGVSAVDDVDGTVSVAVSGTVNTAKPGVYPITYTARDAAGNVSTVTRQITIRDMTAPVITVTPTKVTLELGSATPNLLDGVTVTDNVDTGLTATANGSVNTKALGSTTITYSAKDQAGNIAQTVTRTYEVVDTQPPALTEAPGRHTVRVHGAAPNPAAAVIATDNSGASITPTCQAASPADQLDMHKLGTYRYTCTASDPSGNVARPITVAWEVIDDVKPTIANATPTVTLEAAAAKPDFLTGITASDNYDASVAVTPNPSDVAAFQANRVGTYVVRYDAKDSSGNAAVTVSRTYTVRDTTAPAITVQPTTVRTWIGAPGNDPLAGVTATDIADPSPIIQVSGPIDFTKTGTFEVTYTARDASGNTSQARRTYIVDALPPDVTKPVLTVDPDTVTLELGAATPNLLDGVTAVDDRDGTRPISVNGTAPNTGVPGRYTITYRATDVAGNVAEATRTYVVRDPLTDHRVGGSSRYETAVIASRESNRIGKPVVLVTGESSADALAAGPVAAQLGGTLLLSLPDRLPQSTAAEIARLHPPRVIVVGSAASLGAAVERAVTDFAPDAAIQRIGGASRVETSAQLAEMFFPNAASAYLTTGWSFPDALSAASASALQSTPSPVLLTPTANLEAATVDAVLRMRPGRIQVVGGTPTVSASVEVALRLSGATVSRLAGADRYATNRAVMLSVMPTVPRAVVLATGANYPDALVAVNLVSTYRAPLLLVPGACATPLTGELLGQWATAKKITMGSASAVSDSAATQICR